MNELFDNNLAIWAQTNPHPAILLPYVDCSMTQLYKTNCGEINLKYQFSEKTEYIHSQEGALKESQAWFATLNLKDIQVLYVFGVGLGYAYDVVKPWLEQNPLHSLIFIEDNLTIIRKLLEIEKGTQILNDPQVRLHYFQDLEDRNSPLQEQYWETLSIQMVVSALPFYARTRNEFFIEVKNKLEYDCNTRDAALDEYLTFGAAFYRNFYANILHLPGAALGDALKNHFPQIPAIICGAGPSLDKQLPLLDKLRNQALIFSGGSSLNALNAAGIQPHLGIGLDPNPEQYIRLQANSAFELPYIYRNRMEHLAFQVIHGPKLYVTGSGGFDTAHWFEHHLGIQGEEIDEGYNVVNFCLDVARLWGCNPIILIGMDLAYTHKRSYAAGVVEDSTIDEAALQQSSNPDERVFLRPDIYGQPVYTLWKWVSESEWISAFSKKHPELTIVNATEGGLGFSGVPNITLQKAISTFLKQEYELAGWLHGEIQTHLIPGVTKELISELMLELQESLQRCLEHFNVLIADAQSIMAEIQETHQMPKFLQSGLAALAEIELEEEEAYRAILNSFNVVYSKVLNRDLRRIHHAEGMHPAWQQAIDKINLNLRKLQFLKKTTQTHLDMVGNANTFF